MACPRFQRSQTIPWVDCARLALSSPNQDGYYYLCADGSVPPISILPPLDGLGPSASVDGTTREAGVPVSQLSTDVKSSMTSQSSSTGTVFAAPTGGRSCILVKHYGDSPDSMYRIVQSVD